MDSNQSFSKKRKLPFVKPEKRGVKKRKIPNQRNQTAKNYLNLVYSGKPPSNEKVGKIVSCVDFGIVDVGSMGKTDLKFKNFKNKSVEVEIISISTDLGFSLQNTKYTVDQFEEVFIPLTFHPQKDFADGVNGKLEIQYNFLPKKKTYIKKVFLKGKTSGKEGTPTLSRKKVDVTITEKRKRESLTKIKIGDFISPVKKKRKILNEEFLESIILVQSVVRRNLCKSLEVRRKEMFQKEKEIELKRKRDEVEKRERELKEIEIKRKKEEEKKRKEIEEERIRIKKIEIERKRKEDMEHENDLRNKKKVEDEKIRIKKMELEKKEIEQENDLKNKRKVERENQIEKERFKVKNIFEKSVFIQSIIRKNSTQKEYHFIRGGIKMFQMVLRMNKEKDDFNLQLNCIYQIQKVLRKCLFHQEDFGNSFLYCKGAIVYTQSIIRKNLILNK